MAVCHAARSLNNSRIYFFAFLNHANLDSGVSLDGPILLVPLSALGLDLVLALAARFLALSVVFFAADLVAALALVAVAFALAGAFLAAAFAAVAVFLVAFDAPSSLVAAAATFFATAACRPALTNFAVPAVATLETVSNFALTNFFAVAAPTPGIAVSLDAFESFLPEAMVSPNTAEEQLLMNSCSVDFFAVN